MKNKSVSPFRTAAKRFINNRLAMICLVMGILVLLACLCAPLLTSWDPLEIEMIMQHHGMASGSRHLLGTDPLGRDLFSRLLYGGRNTFKITFGAVAFSLLGAVFGILSGYAGGRFDMFISRICDGLASIPVFLMAIICEMIFGWGRGFFLFALGTAMIPPLMKLSRGLTIDVKDNEFIEAARALGVKEGKIIVKHILPNIAPQLIVHISGSLADAMINCTILGYLSIGITPPKPEWGNIVSACISGKMGAAAITAAVIAFTILCFAIAGNGVRDAFAAGSKED